MDITDVRIELVEHSESGRLVAFASVTFDNSFVVKRLRIISGTKGLFVAMPSRKLTRRCPECGGKNHLHANYCNDCGSALTRESLRMDERGRSRLHVDIAHPVDSRTRERVESMVLQAYRREREKAGGPQAPPPDPIDHVGSTGAKTSCPGQRSLGDGRLFPSNGAVEQCAPEKPHPGGGHARQK